MLSFVNNLTFNQVVRGSNPRWFTKTILNKTSECAITSEVLLYLNIYCKYRTDFIIRLFLLYRKLRCDNIKEKKMPEKYQASKGDDKG